MTSKLNTPASVTPIPIPSPQPSESPRPNPATESLTCSTRELGVATAYIYKIFSAISLFCAYFDNITLDDTNVVLRLRASGSPSGADQFDFVFISVYRLSKCRFNIEGKGVQSYFQQGCVLSCDEFLYCWWVCREQLCNLLGGSFYWDAAAL